MSVDVPRAFPSIPATFWTPCLISSFLSFFLSVLSIRCKLHISSIRWLLRSSLLLSPPTSSPMPLFTFILPSAPFLPSSSSSSSCLLCSSHPCVPAEEQSVSRLFLCAWSNHVAARFLSWNMVLSSTMERPCKTLQHGARDSKLLSLPARVCVCVHVCELDLEPQCLYSMIDDYLYVHEHFSGEISACL